jgi:hypothetical protein
VEAPLIATMKDNQLRLATRSLFVRESGYQFVPRAWVADFQPDGTCRAMAIDRFGGPRPAEVTLPNSPAHQGPAPLDLPALRDQMKQELIAQGLFADEAEAMLATWELSYFKSAGLRVFYIVPDDWVNATLPLTFSIPVDVKRAMIGRLELIAPWQRELIRQIATAPVPAGKPLADHPTAVAYEKLGRFRNALVLDELARRPTESLRAFVKQSHLEPFGGPGVK